MKSYRFIGSWRSRFVAAVNVTVSLTMEPHMTLLYNRNFIPETYLGAPLRWEVREFVLVHSLVGKSKHEHFGRWPLIGQQE